MTSALRVGVIGLGPLWRRQYAPALRGLGDRFEVAAVCDQVHDRAERAAKRLGCAAAAGPTDLLQREPDALLLLDPQWHGLWSAGLACRTGKPVFCCPPAELSGDEGESLRQQAEAAGVTVLLALPLRVAPAVARLRDLLRASLGPPRLVLASGGAAIVGGLSLLDLLDSCVALFDAEPTRVARASAPDLASLVLEYADGRAAQLSAYRRPGASGRVRVEVMAERGRAVLRPPDQLEWWDADGWHAHRPARKTPVARTLLEQFYAAVVEGHVASPGLAEVVRLLALLSPPPPSAPAP